MQKMLKIREKRKYITIEKARGLIACAYAKGVADGCNHMLAVERKKVKCEK